MSYLYDVIDDFISLLFPRVCYGCGDQLMRNENLICTGCYLNIPRTDFHNEKSNPLAQLFWGRCMVNKAAAFSYFNRGNIMRNLIHNLKYKGIREIGYELGSIYGRSLKRSGFTDDIDIIIPVPLHPSRQRVRGFNQSEIISQGIASATGIDVDTLSLVRKERSSSQTRRSRYERWENVRDIFTVTRTDMIKGRHLLLVDDVVTTGSTIESCVMELTAVEGVGISVAALAYADV
jgi:ComF family protein